MTQKDAHERLQYLFWQKLDQAQRKSILVDLNILAADFKASSAWIWHGLIAVRKQGKLSDLWAAIMAFLPDDEQENNPFSPSVGGELLTFILFDDFEPGGMYVGGQAGVLVYIREQLEQMKDGTIIEFTIKIQREDMTKERIESLPIQ